MTSLPPPRRRRSWRGPIWTAACTNQTFTQVALVDEVPVGIIMVKDRREKRCPFRLRLRMLLSVASLFLSKEGRMVTRFFSGVEEIDRQLLQDTQTEYQGEIAFFAVNSRYRGIGLGKKLFDAARDYMRNRRISNFFLFTDTTCNYPFYERRGMERRGERVHTFAAKGKSIFSRQGDIENNGIYLFTAHHVQCFFTVFRNEGIVSRAFKKIPFHVGNGRLIFHDEYIRHLNSFFLNGHK